MVRLHEDFFTRDSHFADQMATIRTHWGFDQASMFYPGTGPDIVVPLQYLAGTVDRIFFCDNDMRSLSLLEDEDITKEFAKVAISIYNVKYDVFKCRPLTRFEAEYNGHRVQVIYFHFSWQLALDYFISHGIKIGLLYLYGWGGEGGCEWLYYHHISNYCRYIPAVTRKVQAKFHAVFLENYIEIAGGRLKYRSLAQFRGNWEHQFTNGLRLRFFMRDLFLPIRAYDGIVVSYDMYIYFSRYHPDDPRGDLLRNYDQQGRLMCSGRWRDQDSFVLATKILKFAREGNWDSVATIAFGNHSHDGLLKAIVQSPEPSDIVLDIYYIDPTDFADLRNSCILHPY